MRPTFAQIGWLLKLQAEAGVMSDIPDTQDEALVRIATLVSKAIKNGANLNSTK